MRTRLFTFLLRESGSIHLYSLCLGPGSLLATGGVGCGSEEDVGGGRRVLWKYLVGERCWESIRITSAIIRSRSSGSSQVSRSSLICSDRPWRKDVSQGMPLPATISHQGLELDSIVRNGAVHLSQSKDLQTRVMSSHGTVEDPMHCLHKAIRRLGAGGVQHSMLQFPTSSLCLLVGWRCKPPWRRQWEKS